MKINDWKLQRETIIEQCLAGKTLEEIGIYYNVSKQRISQILYKLRIDIPVTHRGSGKKSSSKKELLLKEMQQRFNRETWIHKDDLSRAMASTFIRKRQNARNTPWEWSIKHSDITFPEYCPILGIKIDWFASFRNDNSPSFDRVDNTKGYIPGNVIICSWRANRIKNNGTAEEHKKIYEYLTRYFSS